MESEHVALVRYLGSRKDERVHTSRLAFYSDSLTDQRGEVEEQFLYDTDQGEIESFNGLDIDDESNEIVVKTKWKGFSDFEDSWEPVEELAPQVPTFLFNYLVTLNTPLAKRALQILEAGSEKGRK